MSQEVSVNSREIIGVVLGGGQGTRLRPLTSAINKHLLPVGPKPLIYYPIEQLAQAGIKDILLVVDEKFGSQFMTLLKDGQDFGLRSLSYVWQSSQGLGLPTAISSIEPWVNRRKFIVACGDVITEGQLGTAVQEFSENTDGACIISTWSANTAGFSHLLTQNEQVTQILAKDTSRQLSGLIDLGIYLYNPNVFKAIHQLRPSGRGETEIWDLNRSYCQDNRLFHSKVEGWWSDVGQSLDAYYNANQRYAKS